MSTPVARRKTSVKSTRGSWAQTPRGAGPEVAVDTAPDDLGIPAPLADEMSPQGDGSLCSTRWVGGNYDPRATPAVTARRLRGDLARLQAGGHLPADMEFKVRVDRGVVRVDAVLPHSRGLVRNLDPRAGEGGAHGAAWGSSPEREHIQRVLKRLCDSYQSTAYGANWTSIGGPGARRTIPVTPAVWIDEAR